jgi:phage N-6-adenine-methyltransferase
MPRTARPRPGFPDWWTTDDWSTPPDVIETIKTKLEIPAFDLDPCCRVATAKAPAYYSLAEEGMNGLELPWFGTVYVNMPYSNPKPWVEKAIAEARAGNAESVLLLPADISTEWWRYLVVPYSFQYVWPGRIKFLGYDGQPLGSPKGGTIVAHVHQASVREFAALKQTAIMEAWQ